MSELSHKDWMVKAAAIRFRDKAFIDGQFVAARSGRTFASINPATTVWRHLCGQIIFRERIAYRKG